MITYSFLQQYWWFLISLLGGLLVFLLFVQGGNSLLFSIGKTEEERRMLVNSTGRKWEFTFTTLVTFGGAFFASFPLFYSTSFGGAYLLWMLILLSFVVQAVSYEFQSKSGSVLGRRGYRIVLAASGFCAPFLLGIAVATFFTGAPFTVAKDNLTQAMPIVSTWDSPLHGLEAIVQPWNIVLGLAVLFLARMLGALYYINNVADDTIVRNARIKLLVNFIPFLIFFLAFVVYVLTKSGLVATDNAQPMTEDYMYLHHLLAMPACAALLLVGVVGVLYGTVRSVVSKTWTRGIWAAGAGTVLTVTALLLLAGLHGAAYYPSTTSPVSSLTIENSCSSFFTLKVMAVVSLFIPIVLAYIAYCWNAIDHKSLTSDELNSNEHQY
jgi:cytochrome d ubiquinol oxidase subunit II